MKKNLMKMMEISVIKSLQLLQNPNIVTRGIIQFMIFLLMLAAVRA